MKKFLLTGIFLLIFTAVAVGQAPREFNWVPSGKIDVGDLQSENDSDYRSVGEIISSELTYSDGTRYADKNGRRSDVEVFTVIIGRYRGGPCPADMVIRRCIDTGTKPEELTIFIDGKEQGKWLRPEFEGTRRLADVYYIIPKSALMVDDPNNPRMKDRVTIKITSSAPYDSYTYYFFMTREWEMMPEGYTGGIAPREGNTPADLYINALVKEGDHLWEEARELYKSVSDNSKDFEFARCARMRIRRCNYFLSASKVIDTNENKNFDTHFLLGQYAASNNFWYEALNEYTKAVEANTASGDATYNLGEAMQFCRMPVEKYAPIMGRAGWLYNRKDVNHVTAHVAINTVAIPGEGGKPVKALMSTADMDASYNNWRMIEQMVWGASRGAWKINTTFTAYTEKDLPWIMHLGWLWGPPNEAIPEWGMFDHTISHAAYGSSHAGGIDCGPAWSGCSQVGPTRGWEVILHEWNHQFDWTAICGEQGRGYPTTHDSDGCGKQPIVDMGTGHLSSMRYYLRPAQYKRIEPSDPKMPQTHIKTWMLYGPLDAPILEGTTDEAVLAELKSKGLATDNEIKSIPDQAKGQNKSVVEYAKYWFYNSPRMDLVKAVEDEAHFGPKVKGKLAWKPFNNEKGGRVDLNAIFPKAAPKAYAYANVYIFSPEEKEVRVWYGYHDSMRVWHNGRLVHEGRYYTTAYYDIPTWMDMVAGHLKLAKGWNSLLVKVERCGGFDYYGLGKAETWGFSVNLVNWDNSPVTDVKYQSQIPGGEVAVYKRPDVGKYYSWDDVSEDYVELLPELTEEDFRKITGIPELTLAKNAFLAAIPQAKFQKGSNAITLEEITKAIGDMTQDGVKVTPVNFLDLTIPGTPQGQEPTPFNKFKSQMYQDVTLNNFLNFDREGAGALRYTENGKPVDLLFIRPEYLDEYFNLIDDSKTGMEGKTRDRILGYWFIPNAAYPSTGNRTWRVVVVAKTYLGENYPIDEQDILAVPALPAKQ